MTISAEIPRTFAINPKQDATDGIPVLECFIKLSYCLHGSQLRSLITMVFPPVVTQLLLLL